MSDTDMSVSNVEAQDLPSLGTLHARAFHPKSEWHRRVLPSSIAPWWEEKYALDINDPTYHLLKISSPDSPAIVLGLVCLRKFEADERGAGRWSDFPPPSQADREAYNAMVKSMIEYREQFMLGRTHICVDHFAVDFEHQGRGLGTRLMARACEIADQEKLDMFVEANEFAETFYQRFGFKTEQRLEMPGGLTECFLIRPSGR
ncbi:acyl-CoA N-acyltransferase [Ilyonectria destructans]|nr:acyl-CoA N-acyltransferase [Ilyonectria destructans]